MRHEEPYPSRQAGRTSPMKIAIDISQIVHGGTGVATYTDQLVRNLLKIDRKNEYILFGISLRKFNLFKNYLAELQLSHHNLDGQFFHIPPKIGEFLGNRLHTIDIENLLDRIDIFHSSDWIQPPSKAKKVTTIHDLVVYKYPEVSHPYIVETQKRRLKWVKKECDRVLVDSVSTKKELIDNLQFNQEKIEVIYPGLSEKYKPVGNEQITRIKQKYGLYDDYILAVGTIEPRKNIKGILSAFEKLMKHTLISTRRKPLELVIVGKFGWGEKIQHTKYIKILGFVDGNDLPGLYSGASMFVFPSFYEGFGFPVLEAMACGCPVITSNCGSLREIAGEAALIVDPQLPEDIALKMTQLFIDQDLRKDLVKKGNINAANFNWEKTAEEVLNIYNTL